MGNPGTFPFGSVLRGFREREGKSQEELAKKLGVHRNTISAWERGEYLPNAQAMVLELGNALQLNEEDTDTLLKASLKGVTAPSGTWNVPYRRNPHFTGRDELLNLLDQHLSPSVEEDPTITRCAALTQPQAIKGLGGIGKTQIAVEYAYRCREQGRYIHILWVNAASAEALITSFVGLAELLPAFPAKSETDQQKLVAAIKHWLEQCKQWWLLIFDNADDLIGVQECFSVSPDGAMEAFC